MCISDQITVFEACCIESARSCGSFDSLSCGVCNLAGFVSSRSALPDRAVA